MLCALHSDKQSGNAVPLEGGARYNESGGAGGAIYGHVRNANLETPPAAHQEFVHEM